MHESKDEEQNLQYLFLSTSHEIPYYVCDLYVSGCVMAGLGDLSFDWRGYSAALTSCALQSTYLLLVERSGSEKGSHSSKPVCSVASYSNLTSFR